MKWIAAISVLYLASCTTGDKEVGKYTFLEHNSKLGCIIVHTDINCGMSTKTLCYSGELFQTANYAKGQWTFRYRGSFGIPLSFCAKCVSESQMELISDSINARHERLHSEDIQQLIDELQELKKQALHQESEIISLEISHPNLE